METIILIVLAAILWIQLFTWRLMMRLTNQVAQNKRVEGVIYADKDGQDKVEGVIYAD